MFAMTSFLSITCWLRRMHPVDAVSRILSWPAWASPALRRDTRRQDGR